MPLTPNHDVPGTCMGGVDPKTTREGIQLVGAVGWRSRDVMACFYGIFPSQK
jgi:hypothetical protein